MRKYGIEKEVFLKKGEKFCLVPEGYPKDECGWLLELRTNAHSTIGECVDELMLLEFKVYKELEAKGYTIIQDPLAVMPKEIVRKALKKNGKGIPEYQNYLSHDYHKNEQGEKTASIHLSITDQEEILIPQNSYDLYMKGDGKIEVKKVDLQPSKKVVNKSFDFMKYFTSIDKEFKKEIGDAKRNPGMYEMKPDGRVEYRSLPNNIDLFKLIKVVNKVK